MTEPNKPDVLFLALFDPSNTGADAACDSFVAEMRTERGFDVVHDDNCRPGFDFRKAMMALHDNRIARNGPVDFPGGGGCAQRNSVLIYAEGRIVHEAGLRVLCPNEMPEGTSALEVGIPLRLLADFAVDTHRSSVTFLVNPFATSEQQQIEHGRFSFRNGGGGYEFGSNLVRGRRKIGVVCGAGEPSAQAASVFRKAAFDRLLEVPGEKRAEFCEALSAGFRVDKGEGADPRYEYPHGYLTAVVWQDDEVFNRMLP